MKVIYCDLCGIPLKDNNCFMLYISEPRIVGGFGEYCDYMKKVENGVKEICPTCKQIFYKMFELRLKRLSELADEINLTYNLQPKDKKNGKEKK